MEGWIEIGVLHCYEHTAEAEEESLFPFPHCSSEKRREEEGGRERDMTRT
jgi:hypothetical protein